MLPRSDRRSGTDALRERCIARSGIEFMFQAVVYRERGRYDPGTGITDSRGKSGKIHV